MEMIDYECKGYHRKVIGLIKGKHDELINTGLCYLCYYKTW